MLKSQEVRRLAPEMDPLRMGMGWTAQDLEKPQVLIESTYGQSHPGSAHLLGLAQQAQKAADAAGAKAALYFATDISRALRSRDTIANLIEIHAKATTFDAGVFLSSCDKSVPAQLMAIGRIDIPAIVVTGGVMEAGPRPAHPGADRQVQRHVPAGGDQRGAVHLLQAPRLPLLRGLLLYGHRLHHADYGRGLGAHAPRQRPHARHLRRPLQEVAKKAGAPGRPDGRGGRHRPADGDRREL